MIDVPVSEQYADTFNKTLDDFRAQLESGAWRHTATPALDGTALKTLF
jgi:hypothetical protein